MSTSGEGNSFHCLPSHLLRAPDQRSSRSLLPLPYEDAIPFLPSASAAEFMYVTTVRSITCTDRGIQQFSCSRGTRPSNSSPGEDLGTVGLAHPEDLSFFFCFILGLEPLWILWLFENSPTYSERAFGLCPGVWFRAFVSFIISLF